MTQATQVSSARTSQAAETYLTTSSVALAATTTFGFFFNTTPSLELSTSWAPSVPVSSSEAHKATTPVPSAETTISEASSTSTPIPSLTASEHATIRPAMALCVPTGGLCPSNGSARTTSNGALDSVQDASNISNFLSTVSLLKTSTRAIADSQGYITNGQPSSGPSSRRVRRGCSSGAQGSLTQPSRSVVEGTRPSVETGSASQAGLLATSSSALQRMSSSSVSTEPASTQTSSATDKALSVASRVSQINSTTCVTVYSTNTFVSSSTTATPSSHHSGSGRAFGTHVGKVLFLSFLVIKISCLLS